MRDDRSFLVDILERIKLSQEFVADGRETFIESRIIQEAVIRNLEIIGEATRQISETLRDKHPEIEWRQIGAFRNFVIHSYWNVKLERVWQIIENELPTLQTQTNFIIQELDAENSDD